MRELQVLSLIRLSQDDRAAIAAVDPSIRLIDAGGWFDGELRETWPPFTAARYLAPTANGQGTRAERDALLARAEVVLGGWPYLRDLRARAPRLKWFHQRPAGASNLLGGDLWGSDVIVTTSRGAGNALAIAEYALAGIMQAAKGFHRAAVERESGTMNARAWRPLALAGKTVCVVGAGGIGLEAGRLCAAIGMRVVGTRRRPRPGEALPEGYVVLEGPDALDRLLPEADVVAICCQWTPETTNLFNAARLAAMKPGAILVNVARGEIVDETALAEALARDHLRAAVLDVYVGEFEHPPPAALWSDPRVVVSPHVSGMTDRDQHGGIEIFRANLRAYLDGTPMRNVIDWALGY